MIVEQRVYTIKALKMAEYLAYYRDHGLPIQEEILGNPVGFFTTEVGALNQVTLMWGYASQADREQRRERLLKDPRWQAYMENLPPLIERQENRILVPTDFSPIR